METDSVPGTEEVKGWSPTSNSGVHLFSREWNVPNGVPEVSLKGREVRRLKEGLQTLGTILPSRQVASRMSFHLSSLSFLIWRMGFKKPKLIVFCGY